VQEVADLCQATANAGMFLDDVPCLLDAARRMLGEDLFERNAMVVEVAARLFGGSLALQRQATLEILLESTLDGASRASSQGGDLFVREAVMLQPEDLHVTLHARIGMMIAFVGNGLHVRLGKRNLTHNRVPMSLCFQQRLSVWESRSFAPPLLCHAAPRRV
jgi:hypothetical protein